MADHSGHRQRLRKKFKEGYLEDHEVLELLLCSLIPRVNTNEIAHDLIDRFGSLKGVFCAAEEDLSEIRGVGVNTAFSLTVIAEYVRRSMVEKPKNSNVMSSLSDVKKHCVALFRGIDEEESYLLLFNNAKKIIRSQKVARGDGSSARLNVRELLGDALKYDAVSVAVTHNHPNGRITPSAEDIKATYAIKNSFESIGVSFVDHLIVCGDDCHAILADK